MNNVLAAALTLAALTACGAPPVTDPVPDLPIHWVQGIGIAVEPGTPKWADDDLATIDAFRTGVEYAGFSLKDVQGWIIVINNAAEVKCGNTTDTSSLIRGCAHDSEWVEVATAGADNIYQTALIHEAVHAALMNTEYHGDKCHKLPIWRDFRSVLGAVPADSEPRLAYWWMSESC